MGRHTDPILVDYDQGIAVAGKINVNPIDPRDPDFSASYGLAPHGNSLSGNACQINVYRIGMNLGLCFIAGKSPGEILLLCQLISAGNPYIIGRTPHHACQQCAIRAVPLVSPGKRAIQNKFCPGGRISQHFPGHKGDGAGACRMRTGRPLKQK